MRALILDGFSTPELEQAVAEHRTLPLVRELAFKYGLRVSGTDSTDSTRDSLVLAHQNGMNVAQVYMGGYVGRASKKEGREGEKLEEQHFCIYTPHAQKSRGRSPRERSTFHSNKLSMLIAAIKKNNVIPTPEVVFDSHCKTVISDCIKRAERNVGGDKVRKSNELDPRDVHTLLKSVFDNTPLVDMSIYKRVLDKYDEVDKMIEHVKIEMHRMFEKSFYVLGANKLDQVMVGVYKLSRFEIADNKFSAEEIVPLSRVANIEGYPELLALMTMYKVSKEDDGKYEFGGLLPARCAYEKDFELSIDFDCYPTEFDYVWAVTPCTENYSKN